MSGGHYTIEELTAFADGRTDDGLDALVEHCKVCKTCGDQLAVILLLTSSAARPALVPGMSNAVRRVLPVAAAAVVATVFVLYALLASVAPDPGRTDAPAERTGIGSLATTEPPPLNVVRFQLGVASPAGTDDTIARLQAAGVAVAERRYKVAIPELERLHQRHPSAGHVAAYLGIALYLSGDDSPRVGELLSAGSRDRNLSVATFAQWYYANFLLRTGAVDRAITELRDLADRPTRPGRNSRDLLDRLNIDQQR